MLTGIERRQAFQAKYPGKTLARKSKKEQESIKRHNKRAFAKYAAEQKSIRAEKIRQAKLKHDGIISDSIHFLNNKTVGNVEEAEKLVAQIIDSKDF